MAKAKPTEITVTTIFDGKQNGQQAFIELIILKRRTGDRRFAIDSVPSDKYNQGKVFSDVRVG